MVFVTLYFVPFGKVKCVQRVTCNSLLWYEDAPYYHSDYSSQLINLLMLHDKRFTNNISIWSYVPHHITYLSHWGSFTLEFTHAISVEYNVDTEPRRRVNTWRILVLHICVILNEYSKTTGNSSSSCCLPVMVYHRPFQMFVYVIRCTFILKKNWDGLKEHILINTFSLTCTIFLLD